jgi:hypothetical protein
MQILLEGFVTPGDGGAGPFYWNTTSLGPDNGTSIIVPQLNVPGAWMRLLISQTSPIYVATISDLRAFQGGAATPVIYVEGYSSPNDGGEGMFVYVPTDMTSPDNGGTIIIDALNQRYYRETNGGPISVLWFGGNEVSDYSSEFSNAASVADGGIIIVPPGNYTTATAQTEALNLIIYDANFSGANPINSWNPLSGLFQVTSDAANNNCIVGATENNNTSFIAFPTGVTGYGRMNASGNQAFGVFGRADLYSNGVAQNEFNSYNFASPPHMNWPPDLSYGTTDYISNAILLAAYGNFPSKAAIMVAAGSQPFLTAFYMQGNAASNFGLFIDTIDGAGPIFPALIRAIPSSVNITAQTIGTQMPENAVFEVLDESSNVYFAVKQNGRAMFTTSLTATTATTGSASPLPSDPAGYLEFETWNGSTSTTYKLPFYNV